MTLSPRESLSSHATWNFSRWHQTLALSGEKLGLDREFIALKPHFQGHWFACLPSTNATLWAMITTGVPSGTVVIAAQQTAGQGQRGRSWHSSPGGLYLSLGLELPPAAAAWPLLTQAMAWGLASTLHHLGIPVGIKWPNDLVTLGSASPGHGSSLRKLGGILTEVRSSPGTSPWAVVGLGLNWSNPVPPPGQTLMPLRPVPLPENYPLMELEDLAAIALRAMIQGYYGWQQWDASTLLARYEAHLTSLGQRVLLPDGHWGTVVGLARTGYLRISSAQGCRTYGPGQVQLGYGEGESIPREPKTPGSSLNL